MNNRKAKALRKQAVQSVGNVPNEYQYKTYHKMTTDLMGNSIPYVVYTATLKDGCTRSVYQELKKHN